MAIDNATGSIVILAKAGTPSHLPTPAVDQSADAAMLLQIIKLVRQVSLALLFLTMIKLFAFDFGTFIPTGQAIAFWVLGAFLILYSFVYQQLRRRNRNSLHRRRDKMMINKEHQDDTR